MGYYSSYLILLPALIFAIWASSNVKSTYKKYSQVHNSRGLTGAQVARQILDMNGLNFVMIEHISGELTDHYDPKNNVIRLSDSTFNSTSVAALGVAAHECGHAVQYKESYFPIQIRAAIIPMTNIGSYLAVPLIIIGLLFANRGATSLSEIMVNAGLILYSLVVFFQLITLPVEFNASSRALKTLQSSSLLSLDEMPAAKKTLTAAALTYVAGLVSALATLLRLFLLSRGGRRR